MVYTRPDQDHEYTKRMQNYEASLAGQQTIRWQDSVLDVPSLPMDGNLLDDHRLVLEDGFVRRRDGVKRVLITITGGGGGMYIPSGVTVHTVGGIPAGTDLGYDPITYQHLHDMELYGFVALQGNLFTSPGAGYYEKGVEISPITLTATFVKSLNPTYNVNTVEFKRDGVQIDLKTGSLTSPQTTIDSTSVVDTTTYTAIITDEKPESVTINRTFTFVYPMYGGNMNLGDQTSWNTYADITLAQKFITPKQTTNITDTFVNKRSAIAYPASYGDLTSILDNSNFETLTDYTKYTKTITMQDGVPVLYNIWILNDNASQTDFTNKFHF